MGVPDDTLASFNNWSNSSVLHASMRGPSIFGSISSCISEKRKKKHFISKKELEKNIELNLKKF